MAIVLVVLFVVLFGIMVPLAFLPLIPRYDLSESSQEVRTIVGRAAMSRSALHDRAA